MGLDRKYGRVTTEYGDIADDEPVVVFRAQDGLLPQTLGLYLDLCRDNDSPDGHLSKIRDARAMVMEWQADPAHFVKNPPDSRGPAGRRLDG